MKRNQQRFGPPVTPSAARPPLIFLPPFSRAPFKLRPNEVLAAIAQNPYPTDILLDTSVFSVSRLPLVRELLLSSFSPILLAPVLGELEDLKVKPALTPLRELVFPGGILNSKFRGDSYGVLSSYPRFVLRYVNLLRWRRDAIDREIRRHVRETGRPEPIGKARTKLIQNLVKFGVAESTIKLANKDYRTERLADEFLAVFAVLSPIVTGRDCYLLTADEDVFEQVLRMSAMLFDDYGAYLAAADLRTNGSRYSHRHPHQSPLFVGEAAAIGRAANPDYLLPPPALTNTCTTTVIDVGKLRGVTWVSARNMEPAIRFQEEDQLGRKGDPGGDRSILFTPFTLTDAPTTDRCREKWHLVVGMPAMLTLTSDELDPIPSFDIFRAILASHEVPAKPSRLVTPYADYQQRLLAAARRTAQNTKP
jgi:hypothetical protein